jgi:hypothetical protein
MRSRKHRLPALHASAYQPKLVAGRAATKSTGIARLRGVLVGFIELHRTSKVGGGKLWQELPAPQLHHPGGRGFRRGRHEGRSDFVWENGVASFSSQRG